MGDVDQDSEPLHLPDRGDPGARQPPPGAVFAASVRQHRPPEVSEGRNADTEPEQRREEVGVPADGFTPFQREHQGDLPGRDRRVDLRAGAT